MTSKQQQRLITRFKDKFFTYSKSHEDLSNAVDSLIESLIELNEEEDVKH